MICLQCGSPLSGKQEKWCSKKCRAQRSHGTPATKRFKPEPTLHSMPHREWRHLSDFPNYEISNDGRVRRRTSGSNRSIGDAIRCALSSVGYPEYRLTDKFGRPRAVLAHRLTGIAFLPAPQPGQTMVLHKDDNRLNPRIDNLKWGTAQDNSDDQKINGTVGSPGQRKPRAHDPKYLVFLRSRPCVCCGKAGPSEAAHIRAGSRKYGKRPTGMQEKPDDRWALSLCSWCHRDGPEAQHKMNETEFWALWEMDPFEIAAKYYAEYGGDGGSPKKTRTKVRERRPKEKRQKIPASKRPWPKRSFR